MLHWDWITDTALLFALQMAESSPSKRLAPQHSEDNPDDGSSVNKKPKLEETQQGSFPTPTAKEVQELRDPGKKE